MKTKLGLLVLFGVCLGLVGIALSQFSPTSVKVWGWDTTTGKHQEVLLTGLQYNIEAGTYSFVAPAGGQGATYINGDGIDFTKVPGSPTVISVSTTAFAMVVPAPIHGGECKPSTPPSNQLIIASAPGYFFVCTAVPNIPGKWEWIRLIGQRDF